MKWSLLPVLTHRVPAEIKQTLCLCCWSLSCIKHYTFLDLLQLEGQRSENKYAGCIKKLKYVTFMSDNGTFL